MANASPPNKSRRSFWREYWFELAWLLIVLVGIFLLVERMNIRASLRRWIITSIRLTLGSVSQVGQRLIAFISNTTISDLTGMVLITAAVIAILWRLRWRVMHSERLARPTCPVCGSALHRIHRRPADRLLALVIPVKRYRCKNRDCGWTGLRVASSPLHSRRRTHRTHTT